MGISLSHSLLWEYYVRYVAVASSINVSSDWGSVIPQSRWGSGQIDLMTFERVLVNCQKPFEHMICNLPRWTHDVENPTGLVNPKVSEALNHHKFHEGRLYRHLYDISLIKSNLFPSCHETLASPTGQTKPQQYWRCFNRFRCIHPPTEINLHTRIQNLNLQLGRARICQTPRPKTHFETRKRFWIGQILTSFCSEHTQQVALCFGKQSSPLLRRFVTNSMQGHVPLGRQFEWVNRIYRVATKRQILGSATRHHLVCICPARDSSCHKICWDSSILECWQRACATNSSTYIPIFGDQSKERPCQSHYGTGPTVHLLFQHEMDVRNGVVPFTRVSSNTITLLKIRSYNHTILMFPVTTTNKSSHAPWGSTLLLST